MSNQAPDASGFRFSLKTMLIALGVVGVGAGLLGRLFISNPQIALGILSIVCTVLPFVLAVITIITLGVRSKPVRSAPICSRCKKDLRWMDPRQSEICPDCSADLTEPHAIQFVPGARRGRGLIVWGCVLMLMPFAGFGIMFVGSMFAGNSPNGLGMLSTSQLIHQRLPQEIDSPWAWDELERRLSDGRLTQAEVDSAITKLSDHMTRTKPGGWDSPLSWQGDFVRVANQAEMISDPVLFSLCDAFYGANPTIQQLPRMREGADNIDITINYGSSWGQNSGVGMTLLWEIKQFQLDGKPIEVKKHYKHRDSWSGVYQGPLAVGDHQLSVQVEYAYIDPDKMIGLNENDLPSKRWPKSRKSGTKTATRAFKIYPNGAVIVKTTTDPNKAPKSSTPVVIEHCVVQNDRNGKKNVILRLGYADDLSVPLSCDVSAIIQGVEVKLGHLWVSPRPNGRSSGGSNLQGTIDTIDPAIELADIVLTPNPKHIEQRPEVSEIWGRKIVLPSVPLERLDLENEDNNE